MKNIQINIFLALMLLFGFSFFLLNFKPVKAIDIESLSGKILIQAQEEGQAWYVYPINNRRYFLGRPQEAFEIMRNQGLGITKDNLEEISVGNLDEVYNDKLNIEVPFTSQAPFGDWSDPRLQDACEEASVLMAMKWVNNESLSAQEAREEFFAISKFEEENYGTYRDTSAKDTYERIIKDYYKYDKAELRYDFSLEDIISELDKGNLIIVPTNGKELNNPYYSGAGPDRHMLIVKGYDRSSDEFITNDPGTRHGADFRFTFDNLYSSIRDYPSGNHKPILEDKKAMIIIYN
jgi:hypothetical protein